MAFDVVLENQKAFIQLMQLADKNDSSDMLGKFSKEKLNKHWLSIQQLHESLYLKYVDSRLEIILYRLDLQLHGISSALQRLVSWAPEIKILDTYNNENSIATETIFHTLSYFFSGEHISELRNAKPHPDLDFDSSIIIKLFLNANKNDSKINQEDQRVLSDFNLLLSKDKDFLKNIKECQVLLKKIESWIRENNNFGYEINSTNIFSYLAKIEKALEHYTPKQNKILNSLFSDQNLTEDQLKKNAAGDVGNKNKFIKQVVSAISKPNNNRVEPNRNVRNISFESLNRDDILFLLHGISTWYESNEPSSPAPYLIQRAIRNTNVDFHTILMDLIPEGAVHFEKIAGVRLGK
jgi:hypothetical protein